MTLSPPREAPTDALLDKLQEPAVAAAVANLLDHAELVAVLLEGLDQFVARSETIGDSLFASVDELRTTVAGNETLAGFDAAGLLDSAHRLAASGVVSPPAIDSMATVARGIVAGGERFTQDPVEVTGIFSLTRLLKDPDIRRALSSGATVARSLGQELAAPVSPTHRSER